MAKILISDNIRKELEEESNFLFRSNIEPLSATTAEEMLEVHRASRVDLIIVDLAMPQMGGDELCATIRRDDALHNVSIIIVTPKRREDLDKCILCGANDYVLKPLHQQELIKKAGELLDVPCRKHLRVLMNIAVIGEAGGDFYSSSQNISTSGILLESSKVLKKGEQLSLSFFLRLNRISITGEVVRIKQRTPNLFQYGIKFKDLDYKSKQLIEDFINVRKAL